MATNAEVATRLGVSHSTVSRMRSGARLGSLEVLQRMSQEFDIPQQDVMDAALEARAGQRGKWQSLMKRVMGESE